MNNTYIVNLERSGAFETKNMQKILSKFKTFTSIIEKATGIEVVDVEWKNDRTKNELKKKMREFDFDHRFDKNGNRWYIYKVKYCSHVDQNKDYFQCNGECDNCTHYKVGISETDNYDQYLYHLNGN